MCVMDVSSSYQRDVLAPALCVAHHIVLEVAQHIWKVSGGHLST